MWVCVSCSPSGKVLEPEKFGADNEIRPQTIRYGVDLLRPAVGGAGRLCLYEFRGIPDRRRKQLRKQIGFRFTRDRNYNLPSKRLKALEAFLQRQIRQLSSGENMQLQLLKVLSVNQTVSNSQVQTSDNKKVSIVMDKQAEENEKIKNLVLALKKQPREHWAFKGVKREHAHAFIKYPAMMVPQMQSEIIEAFIQQFPEIKSVYDPFVGSGTVMTEAMLHGLAFAGQDINPLAILACYVKKGPFHTKKIKKCIDLLRKRISEDHASDIEVSFRKRDKWFTKEILIELSRIRRAIMKEHSQRVRRFFWLAMVDTVRATSNSRTNTFKLHIRTQEDIASRKISPILVFLREVNDNLIRIQELQSVLNAKKLLSRSSFIKPINIKCKDIIKGGVHHNQQLFDLLVSSPPYGDNGTTVPYGQYSYLPLQWIAPCDIPCRVPLNYLKTAQEIDRQSLGGKCSNKDNVLQSVKTKSHSLKFILEQLSNDKQKRQYKVASFFHDMDLALKNIIAQMANGAFMVFTLGNRRVANRIVPMNVIMRELLEAHGALFITEIYRDIPTKRMAAKNRSSATMTEESLLIMRKKNTEDNKKQC